nr:helix-turn-helix domain-containing protein [Plantactinospora alkalitolerans]
MPDVDPYFAQALRRLRLDRGLSLRGLARLAHRGKSHLHELETGQKQPGVEVAQHLDGVLGANGQLAALVTAAASVRDEADALELVRLVDASDVGIHMLDRVERAVDDLASGYATIPPTELLPQVRRWLARVGRLLEGRCTLEQHRRLLVAGGWLALLRATVHIDLRQPLAADRHLAAASQLADHAGHREIKAWCLETRAWDLLAGGDYRQALELSRQAQAVAPQDSSAFIQATAQEGRAWARMGNRRETRRSLDRVARLASPLRTPDRPEHHYRYDPGKALSYTATTLAWVGDAAAEEYAREVIADLDGAGRPRRSASARLDLGLALLAASKPDEAAAAAEAAIISGRVVASNWWRATEVVAGVERTGIGEANDLRDAYETFRPYR